MAATFEFDESNGAGETVTHGKTKADWKNQDSTTDNYGSFPITDGSNSFEKWIFGHFSGTYNSIASGLWAHTSGAMGTGLTIKGQIAMTSDTDDLAYATPSTAANTNLSFDQTSAIAIASGRAVWFGATSPTAASKAASTTANPAYTNYLTHQLQTSGAAGGDTVNATFTLRYTEN